MKQYWLVMTVIQTKANKSLLSSVVVSLYWSSIICPLVLHRSIMWTNTIIVMMYDYLESVVIIVRVSSTIINS